MKEFKDRTARRGYINGELDKVTALLDQLAADTGEIFVTLDSDHLSDICNLGMFVEKGIRDTRAVIENRFIKAGYVRDGEKGRWVRKDGHGKPDQAKQEEQSKEDK